jgi:hypothetical protein
MNHWFCLISSLPTENATARMRAWRALKASGAAVLRDGVYLMPELEACRSTLDAVAADILAAGGSAYVMRVEPVADEDFTRLFDRSEDYASLLTELNSLRESLSAETAPDVLKQSRKLRKAFAGLIEIDFFPSEARKQAEAALQDLELAAARCLSPDEPRPAQAEIVRLQAADYAARTWATRRRPWVDRLACAWLIRRFIDPQARLFWLDSPGDCPPGAIGFDFDGAAFSHVGARVSFEVLMASFGLEQGALKRLGALVHYLDVGGIQPPEAAGIESVLAGLRQTIADDDQLLTAASAVFNSLLVAFEQGDKTNEPARITPV